MKYFIMIHDVYDVQCQADVTGYIWYGRLNAKFFHDLRKRMAAVFEEWRSVFPFSKGRDLAATIINAYGEQEPVYCTYGGFVAYDIWEMYTGSIVNGTYKLARWTRELSTDEMKMYLNQKYGSASERLRFGDVNYNVRNDVYFDTDSMRGGDPD